MQFHPIYLFLQLIWTELLETIIHNKWLEGFQCLYRLNTKAYYINRNKYLVFKGWIQTSHLVIIKNNLITNIRIDALILINLYHIIIICNNHKINSNLPIIHTVHRLVLNHSTSLINNMEDFHIHLKVLRNIMLIIINSLLLI